MWPDPAPHPGWTILFGVGGGDAQPPLSHPGMWACRREGQGTGDGGIWWGHEEQGETLGDAEDFPGMSRDGSGVTHSASPGTGWKQEHSGSGEVCTDLLRFHLFSLVAVMQKAFPVFD